MGRISIHCKGRIVVIGVNVWLSSSKHNLNVAKWKMNPSLTIDSPIRSKSPRKSIAITFCPHIVRDVHTSHSNLNQPRINKQTLSKHFFVKRSNKRVKFSCFSIKHSIPNRECSFFDYQGNPILFYQFRSHFSHQIKDMIRSLVVDRFWLFSGNQCETHVDINHLALSEHPVEPHNAYDPNVREVILHCSLLIYKHSSGLNKMAVLY